MLTFKNAGAAGHDFSSMHLHSGVAHPARALTPTGADVNLSELGINVTLNGSESIILNQEQIRRLHEELGKFLERNVKDPATPEIMTGSLP